MFDEVTSLFLSYGPKVFNKFVREEEAKLKKAHQKKDDVGLKLEDIRLQVRTYEANIPIVFGEVMLAGNIIWTSEIRKIEPKDEGSSVLNFTNLVSHFFNLGDLFQNSESKKTEFKIDIIIAICEGEVDDLLGVFINGNQIPTENYNFRFYNGSPGQLQDPVLTREKDEDKSPAFRGLCYAVFEDFDLALFGCSIPKFEFFVKRSAFGQKTSKVHLLKSKIKGINLIPGSGEFVYETAVTNVYSDHPERAFSEDTRGRLVRSNKNTNKKISDAMVALSQIKVDLPALEWASVVITWFADGADISKVSIFPAVEDRDINIGSFPIEWTVANKDRWSAKVVSRRKDGALNYGGTVSDNSLISLLIELKKRGYNVILYPMLFVDTEEKPWRGRITGKAEDVAQFFKKKDGYNNFILHYATIAAVYADVFVIGSEMKGLTSVMDRSGNFPAVLEFEKLACQIKSFAPHLKLTYAADWSEYHSINGIYNMDTLWASEHIDFIGIDAYFPLTHVRSAPSIKQIKEGWKSGEGYDFYFDENGKEVKYQGPEFAWKNIRWFVENYHINKDGTRTDFKPNSKKIWFVEFGFPSVDLCSNKPNVFFDPTSSESALPVFSNGFVDFISQRNALLASYEFIEENSDIIENALIWCYDMRPFPFFPRRRDIWVDCDLWQTGHWLNGKLGSNTLDEIIRELCIRSGIKNNELEFENCDEIIEGMCINKASSFESYVKMLCEMYFIKIIHSENGLKFKSIVNVQGEFVPEHSIIKKRRDNANDFDEETTFAALPSEVSLSFIDRTERYEPTSISFNLGDDKFGKALKLSAPIVLSKERALQMAANLLAVKRSEHFAQKVCIPFGVQNFKAGDVLKIEDNKFFIEKIFIDDDYNIFVEGRSVPSVAPFISFKDEKEELLFEFFPHEEKNAFAIEIPALVATKNTEDVLIGIFGSNFSENAKVSLAGFIVGVGLPQRIQGKVVSGSLLNNVNPLFEDETSYIEVFIENWGKVSGLRENDFFVASIGGEICSFSRFANKGNGLYSVYGIKRGRAEFIPNSPKDEFLILNLGVLAVNIPKEITKGEFKIKDGPIEITVPFTSQGLYHYQITIGKKWATTLREGTLFCWTFKSNRELADFDKKIEKIEVELSFLDQKIRVKGDRYNTKEIYDPNIDFDVRIL